MDENKNCAHLSGRTVGEEFRKHPSLFVVSVFSLGYFCLDSLQCARFGASLQCITLQVKVSTFVRHPDSSEMLPAEASGRMRPGDELVDINGNSVEGLNGEEATSLIRQVMLHFGCFFYRDGKHRYEDDGKARQRDAGQGPNKAKHGQAE